MTLHIGEDSTAWAYETMGRMQRSRTWAWIVAGVATGVTALSWAALLVVLTRHEPLHLVEVDKSDGISVNVLPPVLPDTLTQDEVITEFFLRKYVQNRETSDATDRQTRDDYVRLNSTRQIWATYAPADLRKTVQISAVHFLPSSETGAHAAAVQFVTETQADVQAPVREHWSAIIAFRYVQPPVEREALEINPLGFQVTQYRRDQARLPVAFKETK